MMLQGFRVRGQMKRVLAASFVVMGLSGCGGNSDMQTNCTTLPTLPMKSSYTVGFSQIGAEGGNPWRSAESASMQAEAVNRGVNLLFKDGLGIAQQQMADVQSLIAAKVDLLFMAPATESFATSVVQARQACIPVILVDRDVDHTVAVPGKDYVTFLGSDFVAQGKRAAEWLLTATSNTAKIIELEGTPGASPAILRKQGFDMRMSTEAGVTILSSTTANFNRADGQTVALAQLMAHPDATAIYAHNDEMGLGAIDAIKAFGKVPGKDILVVSIDGEKDALQAIIDGTLGCSVQSNPKFGPLASDAMSKFENRQSLPPWDVVQDLLFDKTNAQMYLADAF